LTGQSPRSTEGVQTNPTANKGCPMEMMHDDSAEVTRLEAVDDVGAASDEMLKAMASLVSFVADVQKRASTARGETPSFAAVENELGVLVRDIARRAMTETLLGYEPAAAVVDVGGRVYKRMAEPTPGHYVSLWGRLEVDRYLYREDGVHNGPTVVPLEVRAGMVSGRWTPAAAKAVAHLHQALPAREAAATCERLQVLGCSRSTLLRAGEMLGEHWQAHRTEAEEHLLRELELEDAAHAVSVSVDRVTVPMAEPSAKPDRKLDIVYRQAFCAAITVHDRDGEALSAIRYGQMPRFGRDELERAVARDVDALLSRRPDLKLTGIADGAPEMQSLLDRALGDHTPEAIHIDFWHLLEKLSAAIVATGRAPSEHLAQWRLKLLNDDGAIDAIDHTIRRWLCDYHEDDVPDALYDAFTYLDNNKERMRYATLRANGLPIGSGHVEATCKTLVTVRMKRAGARWKSNGAQACLQLRALACSGPSRWNAAMDFMMSTFHQPVTPIPCAA